MKIVSIYFFTDPVNSSDILPAKASKLFNSALLFLLFGITAQTLSASLLSILNATSPVWGTIIGALRARTRMALT